MMRERKVRCLGTGGFHDMAYVEWGDSENPDVLVCVHGLTRNGRDFDVLADALQKTYRIICPDIVGRGRSDWLSDSAQYSPLQYSADVNALIARLDVDQVDWVGTSMGGIIGMVMAALPGTPIRRMVLNDVGPLLPKSALERIGTYVSAPPVFDSLDGLEAYLRAVHAPFGDLSDAQWTQMARFGNRPVEGGWTLGYDPGIADAFKGPIADIDMWGLWESIACPVLTLRGQSSDLLSPETVTAMTRRGPKATLETISGCGHAPALMDDDQIALIRDWLGEN
ncbi:MAG: alpha/beta fold hydrolase [Alphaproteobacteria bacterium]|jgi:pimeloyl-ACP methyl ester carboxylesterase